MENNIENNKDVIDLRLIFNKIREQKRLFYISLPITFVLSCILILCVPRYYTTNTMLAPEMGSDMGGGTLGTLASSFGINLAQTQSADAISPLLYPDLMRDNAFVTNLFDVKVVSADGEINTTYHDYLKKYQKQPWWSKAISGIKKIFISKKDKDSKSNGKKEFDPYQLSESQNGIAEAIRNNVSLSVDKKTGVITLSVKAQDALICKTMADSIKSRLQTFITDYRTNKARIDLEYYTKLTQDAKNDYETARRNYSHYADANTDVILESYKATQTDMENEMQLKYNTYTTLMAQYQAAKAKVQERTPAFTVIKGANVPIKPAGPKRMFFVICMCFLATIITSIYIIYKQKLI